MRPPDAAAATQAAGEAGGKMKGRKPRVLVAGGGIGGLVLALAARRKGYEVTVFERDMSSVRGEGQYRGPIQIQSNALAALEAIDMSVAEEVMRSGCVTGDRINGLVDGISGSWYAHPLPLSRQPHLLPDCSLAQWLPPRALCCCCSLVSESTRFYLGVRERDVTCASALPADLGTMATRGARGARSQPGAHFREGGGSTVPPTAGGRAGWSAGTRRSFPFPISDPAPTPPGHPARSALRRAASNPRPPRTVPTPAAQPHRGKSLHQSACWLAGTATPC